MKILWPILRFFETDEVPQNYKKSHRIALNVTGALFLVLSAGSAWGASFMEGYGGLVPVVVFFCIGIVALVVGIFGSNGAVAKIWGSKNT